MNRLLCLFLLPISLFCAEIVCKEHALVDEELLILVIDLEGEEDVQLETSMIDEKKKRWTSVATFTPKEGKINLATDAPISGSYQGVDPMGLFWSMTTNAICDPCIRGDFFDVELTAKQDGKVLTNKCVRRIFRKASVEVFDVRENGLVGTLYLPREANNVPVVITLTGSNGGVGKKRAALLASNGIPTFALGYFRAEGLPKSLCEIPLEYFEKAFAFVDQHPRLNGKISLYGVSRGAELSLLLGSVFPDRFEKIVAGVPSSRVYGAINRPFKDAWTYKNKAVIPRAPVPKTPLKLGKGLAISRALRTADFLAAGKKNTKKWASARIPVEKFQGDILLISGGKDQLWPSGLFAHEIFETKRQSATVWKHYELAGHGIGIPFYPASTLARLPMLVFYFDLGGTPMENDLASRSSWMIIKEFLQ